MAGDGFGQRTIRARPSEWAEIDRRAAVVGMERSEYMLACAKASHDTVERQGGGQPLNDEEQREMYDRIREVARRHERLFEPITVYGPDRAGGRGDTRTTELRGLIVGIHEMMGVLHGRKT